MRSASMEVRGSWLRAACSPFKHVMTPGKSPFAGLAILILLTACPALADLKVKDCGAAPAIPTITYQDLLNCRINAAGESRLARFFAQAGDQILIGMARKNTGTQACFRLIDPTGTPGANICAVGCCRLREHRWVRFSRPCDRNVHGAGI